MLQWLIAQKDPAVRVAGYYGLIGLQDASEVDQGEWSRKLLDTLLHDFPADNSDEVQEACGGKDGVDFLHLYAPFDGYALGAAIKMSAVGDYPSYVESIIKSAEKSHDLSVLLRWPRLTASLVHLGRDRYTVPWANRVLALIAAADVKKPNRVDRQALAALRKDVTFYRDQYLPQKYTPPPLGPWAEYVFKPIPLKAFPQDNGKSFQVEMIAVDRQAEAEKRPDPLVMVWCRTMLQRSEDRRCRCVVTRVGIAGGALHEIARFMSQTNIIKAIAMGEGTIFLAFRNQGLTVVGSKGVERYDEARGAPAADIDAMAWLDGAVYIALSGAIARFDPGDGKFTMVASSKAVKESSPLDGGMPYRIQSILADPGRHCLWLSIAGDKREGVWKYTPQAGKFENVSPKTGRELVWSDGRIYSVAAEFNFNWRLYCLDPATLKFTNRQGPDGCPSSCRIPPTWSIMDGRIITCAGRMTEGDKEYPWPRSECYVRWLDRYGRGCIGVPEFWGPPLQLWYVERRTSAPAHPAERK